MFTLETCRRFQGVVFVGGLMGILACGGQTNQTAAASAEPLASGQVVALAATVRLVNVEGGCWVLATSNGRYQPVNLPDAFKSDGKEVQVVLRAAPDMMSICQVAPLVHVDSISAR